MLKRVKGTEAEEKEKKIKFIDEQIVYYTEQINRLRRWVDELKKEKREV